jgi:hypothetical protein
MYGFAVWGWLQNCKVAASSGCLVTRGTQACARDSTMHRSLALASLHSMLQSTTAETHKVAWTNDAHVAALKQAAWGLLLRASTCLRGQESLCKQASRCNTDARLVEHPICFDRGSIVAISQLGTSSTYSLVSITSYFTQLGRALCEFSQKVTA